MGRKKSSDNRIFIGIGAVIVVVFLLLAFNPSMNFLSNFSLQSVSPEITQELILHPNGKGTYTELTPYGSTENWKCVLGAPTTRAYSSAPDLCSLYVQNSARGTSRKDTYQIENHNAVQNIGTIKNIQLVVKYKSWLGSFAGLIFVDNQLYQTAGTPSWSDPARYYTKTFQLDKNPFTNQLWTWDNIDNMEIGILESPDYIAGQNKPVSDVYLKVVSSVDATINSNPNGADVTISYIGATTPITTQKSGTTFSGLDPFTEYHVTVSKQYYQTKTIIITTNDNIMQTVTLDPSHYKITVAPYPQDATVTINTVATKSGMYPIGNILTISVGKTNYATITKSVTVTKEEIVPISLEQSAFLISVTPTPSDASVTINGQKTATGMYLKNTQITIIASKQYYTTATKTIMITGTENIPMALERSHFTITVNPNPSDATVTINGQSIKSGIYQKGTPVTVTANKQYYATASKTIIVSGDETVPLQLQQNSFRLTIAPMPSDATVTMNGKTTSSDIFATGSTVQVQVSKPYFTTDSRAITVTNRDDIVAISLQSSHFRITVNPLPSDATVLINGGKTTTGMYPKGSTVEINVLKAFYHPTTEKIIVTKEQTVPITLQPVDQYDVKFITSPSSCYITIEGTSATGDKIASQTKTTEPGFVIFNNLYEGTYIVTVAKDGYSTIVKTVSLPIAGIKQEMTFTLQQIPTQLTQYQPQNKTPGFEIISLVVAIGITLVLLRIKKTKKE